MPSSRRKRGLIIGVGLLSAAALVAFGTSRARAARSSKTQGDDGDALPAETETPDPTWWDRAKEMAQAAWLLVTQRRPNDS